MSRSISSALLGPLTNFPDARFSNKSDLVKLDTFTDHVFAAYIRCFVSVSLYIGNLITFDKSFLVQSLLRFENSAVALLIRFYTSMLTLLLDVIVLQK